MDGLGIYIPDNLVSVLGQQMAKCSIVEDTNAWQQTPTIAFCDYEDFGFDEEDDDSSSDGDWWPETSGTDASGLSTSDKQNNVQQLAENIGSVTQGLPNGGEMRDTIEDSSASGKSWRVRRRRCQKWSD